MSISEHQPPEEYDALLGDYAAGEDLFDALQDRTPPFDINPLPIDSELARRLNDPITDPAEFHNLRPDIRKELLRVVARPENCLSADQETVHDLVLGLSEAAQNCFRQGMGLRRVDLARTDEGSLYLAVHNLALTYPPGVVLHERRTSNKPVRLGGMRGYRGYDEVLEEDEHGWGLGLIGRLAAHGDFTGMGFYPEEIASIPVRPTDGYGVISRLVFWSLYNNSIDGQSSAVEAA